MRRWLAMAMVLLGARVALAEAPTEARQYFRAGNQAYRAAQYLAAARAYEQAYELNPLPAVTFSAAQAYRRQYFAEPRIEYLERAQALYRRYLVEQPSGGRREHAVTHLAAIEPLLRAAPPTRARPKADLEAATQLLVTSQAEGAVASIDGGRARAVPLLADVQPGKHRIEVSAPGHRSVQMQSRAIESRLVVAQLDPTPIPGLIAVEAPEGAEISLDGRFVGAAPLGAEVSAPAGSHVVTLRLRGHVTTSVRIRLVHGEHARVRVALGRTGQRLASYWVAGGAALLGVGAGVAGIVALDAQGDARTLRSLQDQRDWTPQELADYGDAVDRRDRWRGAALGLGAGAAAAGITAAALHLLDEPQNEPAVAVPRLRGAIAPHGAIVGVDASW